MTAEAARKYPIFPPFTEWVDAFALMGGWDGKSPLPGIRVEEIVEDDAFIVHAELPGLDPDRDIDVMVEHGMLRIHAERHPAELELVPHARRNHRRPHPPPRSALDPQPELPV